MAGEQARRWLNQFYFDKLLIEVDEVAGATYTPVIGALMVEQLTTEVAASAPQESEHPTSVPVGVGCDRELSGEVFTYGCDLGGRGRFSALTAG
ncbi:MAG: hypothetical protein ACYDH6_19190 [Acidimicrobiales bacterium]